MRRLMAFCLIAILLVSGLPAAWAAAAPTPEDYKLRPGDVLNIQVLAMTSLCHR